MPITLCIQPYCQDCDEFEPVVGKIYERRCDGTQSVITNIICTHDARCEHIYKYMKAREST